MLFSAPTEAEFPFQAQVRPELMDRSMETSTVDEPATAVAMAQQEIEDNESCEQLTKYTQYDITPLLVVSLQSVLIGIFFNL